MTYILNSELYNTFSNGQAAFIKIVGLIIDTFDKGYSRERGFSKFNPVINDYFEIDTSNKDDVYGLLLCHLKVAGIELDAISDDLIGDEFNKMCYLYRNSGIDDVRRASASDSGTR